jgi:hypothetical protein
MIREVFERRVAALSFRDEERTTALIDEYRSDLAEVQSAALHYSQFGDADGRRALSVLAQLGETAVEGLASAVATQQPAPDTPLLMDLAEGFTFAESAVVRYLKRSLSDVRLVPQPPGMRVLEGAGPPYRVCDEAYISLRKILNAESLLQYLLESHYFLSLSESDKNREIESSSRTGSFTRFLEDVDAEEE